MLNASDFKHLHRLEIVIGEDGMTLVDAGSITPEFYPVFIATWFVYDDKKCSAGHLHKKYKTMKHTDLLQLIELIKQEDKDGNKEA